jgi:3-deoxy-D-manno-octulosonic-acid transferase
MRVFFYQVILLAAVILFFPVFTFLIYFKKSYRDGLGERLTIYSDRAKRKLKNTRNPVWVHAASVGEVKLLKNIPGFPFPDTVITCTSASGKKVAREMFPSTAVILMPLDFIFLMKRAKRVISPAKVLVVETELWPGFIYTVRKSPVALINGRLSKGKFKWYYLLRKSMVKLFEWIDTVYARDTENLNRFKRLGIPHQKLKEVGNLKYNFELPDIDYSDLKYRKPGHPVLVCGSTHCGEETLILDVFEELKRDYRDLSLIISPRHLERTREVVELLEREGLDFTLWSQKVEQIQPGEVILVDTMGELAKIYSVSSLCFIGGSFVPVGGHNIIEPAVWKVPVVVGPHFHNFENMITQFCLQGGVKVAKSTRDLYNVLKYILSYPQVSKDMGEKNFSLAFRKKAEIEQVFMELKI